YINLVSLLQDSGIPLRSSDRNKFHPLVIAGGISCFLNPEPIAPFLDCFLLGEAETFIKHFFDIYLSSNTREETLKNLAENLPFAYIPSFYKPSDTNQNTVKKVKPIYNYAKPKIKVSYVTNLDEISTTSSILTSETTFKNIFLIETGRGCPHGCRFCSAGFIYRPPRFYSKKNIFKSIEKGKTLTNKIGFVSAAVSDHPAINEICEQALESELQPSFSSFRADVLSNNVLRSIGKSSVKTATIAPEAGSQKMRDIINKNISEIEILNCTEYLVSSGIINLKLYFLIGLPFEEDDDINEIVILIKKIKQVFLAASKKQKKIGTITVSINPFIPKPSTPFQWAGFTRDKTIKRKMNFIKNSLKKIGNIVVKTESIKHAKINAFLSRGDRKAADVLEVAHKSGWTYALKKNADYIDSIVYQTWNTNLDLPWDIIDTGLKKNYLIKEFEKAKLAKTSVPCPVIDCKKCRLCKQD
ncbi:MAG: radical SAM protein, partial [Desulfobacteraceae bacterium]|nr:radical SAM protein [Desulfobacteraceae bacterium]